MKNSPKNLHGALISNGPLSDRMIRMFDRYLDFLEKNRNFVHIIHREINGGKQMERVIAHMIPLFQFVLQGIREAYPKTRAGDLSAEHLLVSGYGMIITYFTCSGIVEKLIGSDPMSPKNLQTGKSTYTGCLRSSSAPSIRRSKIRQTRRGRC